jgi:hypothetical protein
LFSRRFFLVYLFRSFYRVKRRVSPMTFTTFSLFLAGLAATAVPIVLHLLSRGKPKKVVFPALRFARQKFAENKRKLTLKRLLLLALRVGTLVLLGLTLARPVFLPPDDATFLDEARQTGEVGENSENKETAPPALVENRLGRGTVATLATPLSDGTQNDAWNDLTVGDAPWVFVLLADGTARRLASGDASIRNLRLFQLDELGETDLRPPIQRFVERLP